jgi:MFS family permease
MASMGQIATSAAPQEPTTKATRAMIALLSAEVISTTGTEITAIALPWFVLVTTGSPARMGTVLAAGFLGMALLGIPSGRVATALGPRRTMLLADVTCGAAIATIPVLHWTGSLSFPVIVAAAFVVGAFFPAYGASQSLVLASLTGHDETRLVRAGGLLGAFNETASFVGPAAGGALVALLGAAPVLLIDAGSYLVAFALVAALVPRQRGAASPVADRSVRAGLQYIRRNRRLVRTLAGLALVELAFTAMIATLPVLTRERFDAGAGLAGWLLASYGAGSVVGGLLSSRARSVDDRVTMLAIAGIAVSTWPLLAPLPSYGVALAVATNGVFSGLYFPRFFASVTLRTPEPLRARVSAAVTTAISATGPVGFVGAGLLLEHAASVTAAYTLVAASASVGAAVVVAATIGATRVR